MRDRLIELLTDNLPRCGNLPHWDNPLQLSCDEQVERIADHLLANGVIVPPCKVGDSLWNIHYNRPKEWKVVYIGFNGEEWHINVHWSDKDHFVTREIDGKYLDRMFFRTKEEAERLCEDRVSNDPVVVAVGCELKEMVGENDG